MRRFLNLRLFTKILIIFCFIFFSGFFLRTYFLSRNIKELSLKNSERQMSNINRNFNLFIRQKAQLYLKERLVEEMDSYNNDLISSYNSIVKGKNQENKVKSDLMKRLLNIHIGKDGYSYILDSTYTVLCHPVKEYIGKNFSYRNDLKPYFSKRHGFIKYDWQTPGQKNERPKLVYISYFEPWDWIICISAYYDENIPEIGDEIFKENHLEDDLQNFNNIVIDSMGNVVYHPYLKGNVLNVIDSKGKKYFKEILEKKNGSIDFYDKPPGKTSKRQHALFSRVGIFDWIIITYTSEEALMKDSKALIDLIVKVSTVLLIIGLILAWILSKIIISPLDCLSNSMKAAMKGDYSIRCKAHTLKDEIGELALSFNKLLERFQKEIKNREEIEKILEFNEKRYRIQYRNIPIPTFTWRFEGGEFFLIDKNEFAENLLKNHKKKISIIEANEIFDHNEEIINQMKMCLNTGKMVVFEARIWKRDKNIWLAFIEKDLLLMQMEDFTEKNEAHKKILKLNQELEAFAFSVSHDMKTPINTLSWYLDIIEKSIDKLNKDQLTEYIIDMKENILHMRKKVENILRISMIKEKDLKKEFVDLTMLIEKVVGEHKHYQNHNLRIDIQEGLKLFCDYGFTVILVDNLMSNALKFSSRRENPKIEVGFSEEKEAYYIKDNGPGFDMREASRLFDVGVRLHKDEGYTGSGIGLSLVKKVVDVHKGKIWVESEPGNGTTFYFNL